MVSGSPGAPLFCLAAKQSIPLQHHEPKDHPAKEKHQKQWKHGPLRFYGELPRVEIIPFPVRNCTIAKAIGGGRRPPLQCKSKLETVLIFQKEP
jgi:hypothetical protein